MPLCKPVILSLWEFSRCTVLHAIAQVLPTARDARPQPSPSGHNLQLPLMAQVHSSFLLNTSGPLFTLPLQHLSPSIVMPWL